MKDSLHTFWRWGRWGIFAIILLGAYFAYDTKHDYKWYDGRILEIEDFVPPAGLTLHHKTEGSTTTSYYE